MADLIDRQAAIDAIDKCSVWVMYTQGDSQKDEAEFVESIIKQTKKAIQSMLIEDLPSAQSKQTASNYLQSLPTSPLLVGKMPSAQPEPKPGKWIRIERREPQYDIYGVKTWSIAYRCSECGFIHSVIEDFGQYDFCPNCGSYNGDMRQGDAR